ncbi:MAG TPA: flagellar motor switch protein FliN [Acidimicrobiales bacterium]|nr:flagellar motor switch protein FliN [Acidimicrobiales bacterium]
MTMSESFTTTAPDQAVMPPAELNAPFPGAAGDPGGGMPPPIAAQETIAQTAGGATAGAASAPGGGRRSMDVLANVEMTVTVELGRTRMPVRQLLSLAPGSVIELNRSANTPVDVYVNGTLFARGEVVVIDDEFGVRITDIVERDTDSGFGRV